MLTRIHAQCLKQGCVCVLHTVVMNAENGWSWIETGVDVLCRLLTVLCLCVYVLKLKPRAEVCPHLAGTRRNED